MIWFGPAGTSDSFHTMGFKKTENMADYIVKMGLNAFEYQCGRGVRVNPDTAEKLRISFKENNLKMSLHAPYYISLSSLEEEKRLKSIDYILQSARAADMLGAKRIVVHSGSCAKLSRGEALELAKGTIKMAVEALKAEGLSHITICPETMGKINQLGDLWEVTQLCRVDDSLIPCVDFGHLNARTLGKMNSREDFSAAFKLMDNEIGRDRLKALHSHFSKIMYTEKGGELRHLTFADEIYGPNFEPLAEQFVKYDCSPTVICESAGTQAEDAGTMLKIYNKTKEEYDSGNKTF